MPSGTKRCAPKLEIATTRACALRAQDPAAPRSQAHETRQPSPRRRVPAPRAASFAKPRRSAKPAACTIASIGPKDARVALTSSAAVPALARSPVRSSQPCAGALAFRRDRFQPRQPCLVRALPVQHQALIRSGKPARHRRSDPGAAAGDDGNPHPPDILCRSIGGTIGAAHPKANDAGISRMISAQTLCVCRRENRSPLCATARPAGPDHAIMSEPPHAEALVAPAAAGLHAVLVEELGRRDPN